MLSSVIILPDVAVTHFIRFGIDRNSVLLPRALQSPILDIPRLPSTTTIQIDEWDYLQQCDANATRSAVLITVDLPPRLRLSVANFQWIAYQYLNTCTEAFPASYNLDLNVFGLLHHSPTRGSSPNTSWTTTHDGNRNASTCHISARPSSNKVMVYNNTVEACPAACAVPRIMLGDASKTTCTRLMTSDRFFYDDGIFVSSCVIATCLYFVKRFLVKRHKRVSSTHRSTVFKSIRDEAFRIDELVDPLRGKPMHQQKQALGEKIFKFVKAANGPKLAGKITIQLLDREDIGSLVAPAAAACPPTEVLADTPQLSELHRAEHTEALPLSADQGGNSDMTSDSPVDYQCASSDFSLATDAGDETTEPRLISAGNTSIDSDSCDSLPGSLPDFPQLPSLISTECHNVTDSLVVSIQEKDAETANGLDRETIDCLLKTPATNDSAENADSANLESSPSLADYWYDISELDCPTDPVSQTESMLNVSISSVAEPADDVASVTVATSSTSSNKDGDLASTLEDEEDIPWNVSLDGYKPGFDFSAAAKSSGMSLNVVEVPTVEPPRRRTRRGGRRARNCADRNATAANN